MAVITREDLLNRINGLIGEENNDDVLSLIEDVTDTLDDYDTRVGTAREWEERYNQNDAEWRQRYRDRFFEGGSDSNPDADVIETIVDSADGNTVETNISYDELFTTSE